MAITIREVAERAGVCAGTVSLVLNKKPGISEATRMRVEQALKELNYKPNVAAQRLVKRQIRTIGVIYSDHLQSGGVPGDFMLDVFEGIRSITDTNQANLILVSVEDEFRENHVGVHMMHRDKLAGVVLIAVDLDSPYLTAVRESGLPFVDVNRRLDDDTASYVVLDYMGAVVSGVRHLRACGYEKIGLMIRGTRPTIARDLIAGYKSALAGSDFSENWIASHDATAEGGRAAMLKLLDVGVDAVFASDNSAARGAVDAALERGLRVPEDVGVVGMRDYSESDSQAPRLTMVRYPTEELGRAAVDTLFRVMDNQSLAAQRTVIRTELEPGETTAVKGSQQAGNRRRARN